MDCASRASQWLVRLVVTYHLPWYNMVYHLPLDRLVVNHLPTTNQPPSLTHHCESESAIINSTLCVVSTGFLYPSRPSISHTFCTVCCVLAANQPSLSHTVWHLICIVFLCSYTFVVSLGHVTQCMSNHWPNLTSYVPTMPSSPIFVCQLTQCIAMIPVINTLTT